MSTATNSFGSFPCQNNFQNLPENYHRTTEIAVDASSVWVHPYHPNLIVPKMEHVIKPNTMQTPQTPRFLLGNAANFQRIETNYYERPLLMDAWAQTTVEDFGLITDEHRDHIAFLQRENEALHKKVQMLEEDLRVHSDLLNQIHATAALKTKTHEITENISPTPPVTPVMSTIKCIDVQEYKHLQRVSPPQANHSAGQSQMSPVMNSMQSNGGTSFATTDSVKYTIISNSLENHENQSVEPIEIQIAEEDGALNLNSSAESGRLEICLGEHEANQGQQAGNFKTEATNEEHALPPMPAQSGILIKRRRVHSQNQDGTSHAEYSARTPIRYQERNGVMQNSQSLSNITPEQSKPSTLRHLQDDNVMVCIGPNNTRVPSKLYESLNWDNPSIATRKLLMAIFDRHTLATHSMTGKPSPAFKGQAKPQKQRLDPKVTEDIVFVVTRRCNVSDKEVRNAITTKCADENKMMKLQMNKKNSQRNNKENQHYNALTPINS